MVSGLSHNVSILCMPANRKHTKICMFINVLNIIILCVDPKLLPPPLPVSFYKDGWMDERCFRPLFCTIKAELGRGQPGLMR